MKSISPNWDLSAHDSNSWVILPCPDLQPSIKFSLPCPAEEGSEGAALLATWLPARIIPPHKVCRGWEWFPKAAGNCCREHSSDLIKALNILQATQSIHPSIWWKDCKFPYTHPATSWISWLGKRGKMNSYFILPFPHKPEQFCHGELLLCSEQGAQQNPGCWDPIHADHVSMGPHPCRPCVTALPDALPPAASSFSVSLGCPKGSKIPPGAAMLQIFHAWEDSLGTAQISFFLFSFKKITFLPVSPGLHRFILHFQSSENPSHRMHIPHPWGWTGLQQLCRDLRAEGWRPETGGFSQLDLTHGSAGTSLAQGRGSDPPGRGEAKGI